VKSAELWKYFFKPFSGDDVEQDDQDRYDNTENNRLFFIFFLAAKI